MLGVISPRYLASLLGGSLLALFCFGVFILAFDMYSRDENNHIHEVIAIKPVGNLQFFWGRLFGIYMLMGIPLISVVALGVGYGLISEIFAIPFGEPIEPWSVLSLLLLDVVPNFVFYGGLVLFLASFIRPRFIALLLSTFCLYGWLWLSCRLPLTISLPLHTVTGNVIFPSDLIPTFANVNILINRVAIVLIGLGFLYFLTVLYPRNASSGKASRTTGVFAVTTGVILIVAMYLPQVLEQQKISIWKRVHDEHFDPVSTPDVHHVEGNIDIYPGRSIQLELSMSVSVRGDADSDFALFSFNPGYRIDQLSIDEEAITDYQFRRGLLKIPRKHFANQNSILTLKAKGRPNAQFAYLDSVDKVSMIFGPEVRQLRFLGTENYIFRSNFVVLMPGIKWYPVAGTATNEDFREQRLKDFFTVDLNVSVPRKWILAGPSQRELQPDRKRTTYRIHTTNPVPQLALVASRFERVTQNINGIEFEVLYKGAHRRTFESLTPLESVITSTIQESLDSIESTGLLYPYAVYSLVEVPASLRVFGGGHKLDSVLGMPGILMMPETTLPTLHIESLRDAVDIREKEELEWTDEEWMNMLVHPLLQYFGIELYAGNYLSHFYRSIVSDQTSATGPKADALNLILEQVVHLMLAENYVSFDFQLALDREILDLTYIEPFQIANIGDGVDDRYRTERLLNLRESQAGKLTSEEILQTVQSIVLADYDTRRDFDIIDYRAFRLRGKVVAMILIDVIGIEALHSIVAELLRSFRAKKFSYKDFLAVALSQGVDLKTHLEEMLHSSNLPGFVVSNLTQRRIEDKAGGDLRYQATFLLQNAEPVSGYCMLIPINDVRSVHDPDTRFTSSRVLFVEKNQTLEIVIESTPPIIDIVIAPYLSLNRTELRLNVTSVQDVTSDPDFNPRLSWGGAQIVSIREVETESLVEGKDIIVDDLDQGFSIVDSSKPWNFRPLTILARRLAGKSVIEQIRGLPAFQFDEKLVPVDTWERKTDTTAYGRYWRTFTVNRSGYGRTFAKFVNSLPLKGSWRLDYFVPEGNFTRVREFQGQSIITRMGLQRGIANIDVHLNSDVVSESIDMSAVIRGWHTVGEYEIEQPDVEVRVSNGTKWRAIFADAIRWTPLDSPE